MRLHSLYLAEILIKIAKRVYANKLITIEIEEFVKD